MVSLPEFGISVAKSPFCFCFLFISRSSRIQVPDDYGSIERSGKLVLAVKILREWLSRGHKALLFSQTQQVVHGKAVLVIVAVGDLFWLIYSI